MCAFLLPKSIREEIERMINSFYHANKNESSDQKGELILLKKLCGICEGHLEMSGIYILIGCEHACNCWERK